MATATKAAAFAVFLRMFDVALIDAVARLGAALAVLATITIIVGNVGALGQSSLKRMLAYSSVARRGYLLIGVVVPSRLGLQATVFYLVVYMVMNVGGVRGDRRPRAGDRPRRPHRQRGRLGTSRPLLAAAMDRGDAVARRHPGDRRLHREVLPHRSCGGRRLHVAWRRAV
jgi:NADH-quinone oxidoreductase subunit N